MFTIDRIRMLSLAYGCTINCSGGCPVCSPEEHSLHEVMNSFDEAAGIDTSGGVKLAPLGRHGVVGVNYVGARLALHEKHLALDSAEVDVARWERMDSEPEHYFHWLGRDAQT